MNETVRSITFGSRNKPLLINDEIISYNYKTVNRSEITGIKYWISPIVFYHYVLGRKYYIGFKTTSGQLDIIFRSLFGISNSYFEDICDRITDEVWEPVTDKLLNESMEILKAGKTLEYDYCQLNREGIMLPKKQQLINWHDLVYEKKYDRLVLNSKSDHTTWTNLEFGAYWNIDVLITLLDWITLEGGLQQMLNHKT